MGRPRRRAPPATRRPLEVRARRTAVTPLTRLAASDDGEEGFMKFYERDVLPKVVAARRRVKAGR